MGTKREKIRVKKVPLPEGIESKGIAKRRKSKVQEDGKEN